MKSVPNFVAIPHFHLLPPGQLERLVRQWQQLVGLAGLETLPWFFSGRAMWGHAVIIAAPIERLFVGSGKG